MINQVTIVGRLVKTPDLFLTENGKKGAFITLAVGRPFKNISGEYDTDYIDCNLWTGIAENTAEYCRKGDVIGIRGRLQTRLVENDDGTKTKKMDIIAEKVTFLSSAKPNHCEVNDECEDVITQDATNQDVCDNGEAIDKKEKKKK